MLRVQADGGLAAFQNVAQQELEQVALALAAVAQDEDVGCGLVIGAAVQIHDDVGAVPVPANVEAVGVRLAGVVERVQIGNGFGRQHPLKLGAEGVAARRIGGEESLPLAQEEPVRAQLAPDQLRRHLIPQGAQTVRVSGGELNEHSAVDEGLAVLAHGGDERRHILEVGFRSDRLLHAAGAAPVQLVLVLRVVDDFVLLCHGHPPVIDVQGHAALFPQAAEQSQLLGAGGVAPQGQGAAVGPAADVVVRVELHGCGGDEVQEILDAGFRGLGRDPFIRFLLNFFSHGPSPPSLRRSPQSGPWSHPAGSRPTADA